MSGILLDNEDKKEVSHIVYPQGAPTLVKGAETYMIVRHHLLLILQWRKYLSTKLYEMSEKIPCPQVAHRLIFKVVEMGSILSVCIQHSENIQSKRVCQKSL